MPHLQKCYLQCGSHWHIARYEGNVSVANQLPVYLPGCSYRLQLCMLCKMAAQQFKHLKKKSSVFTVYGRGSLAKRLGSVSVSQQFMLILPSYRRRQLSTAVVRRLTTDTHWRCLVVRDMSVCATLKITPTFHLTQSRWLHSATSSFLSGSSQPITLLILANKTVPKSTPNTTQKPNNTKYSKTKLPWAKSQNRGPCKSESNSP